MTASPSVTDREVRLAAMDLLARREHGRAEISRKLQRRFNKRDVRPELIDDVLDALQTEGLLSEVRYAEALLRQLLAKGCGPIKLQQEIDRRELSAAARAHLQPDIERVDWFAAAETVYFKKFGDELLVLTDFAALRREQAKRARFMQYRGFRTDHFFHLIEALQVAENDEHHDDYPAC